MAKNVNQSYPTSAHLRLYNTSGADVVTDELCLLGAIPAVAEEDITSGEQGGFLVGGNGAILQTAEFVTDEGTFAAGNASVYFDTTTKKISDTSTAGYYLVGQTTEPLTNGVVNFILYPTATVVPEA